MPERSLPQPGGFEGVVRPVKPLVAHDLPGPDGPQRRLVRLHVNPAHPPVGSVADNGSHTVTPGYEPFRLYLPCLPPLECVANRLTERIQSTTAARLDRARRVDVFDLR